MATLTAREILRREYGSSRNFLTRSRVRVGKCPGGAWELSTGEGFFHKQIWGVSVVRLLADGTTQRCYGVSQCFASHSDAEDYIDGLKRDGIPAEQTTA